MILLATKMPTAVASPTWNLLLWVVLGITAVILVSTIIISFVSTRAKRKVSKDIEAICQEIHPNSELLMTNMDAIVATAKNVSPEMIAPLLTRYASESKLHFQGEWLLSPSTYICPEASEIIPVTFSYNPILIAVYCLGGFIFSIAVGLVGFLEKLTLSPLVIMLPFATGLLASLFYVLSHRQTLETLTKKLTLLRNLIAAQVPVFSEKDGVGALVAQMIKYDYKVNDSVQSFDQTVKQFIEGDLSRGIADTVRSIMSDEIAPSVREATNSLTALATTLAQKQEDGMNKLADQFTGAVVNQLQTELEPMHHQMSAFTKLVSQACQYTQTMLEALEQAESEQLVVKNEIALTLKELARSKSHVATEMAQIEASIDHINKSTHKLTALYNHEEIGLTDKIDRMANSLDEYAKVLASSIGESARSLSLASQLTENQQKSANEYQAQIAQEIDALREIQRVLDISVTSFTDESGSYLNRTLKSFDVALGEIVERLTYTATEIRDAVESLPAALDALHHQQN